MDDGTRTTLTVVAVGVFALAAGIGLLATSLSVGSPSSAPDGVHGVGPDVSRLHAAGATGENVTVGVVDVTGFDTSTDALDGRVTEARAFDGSENVQNGGHNAHGTAAAETVARVAPDADIHVATFDSSDGYRRAVEWLVAEEVDVVVAPVSFYGKPGDGSSSVARVAADATREGVVFVSPAGNVARGHWVGPYRNVENGTLAFGKSARNYLRGDRREVTVWLSWDDDGVGRDFTAELYWTDGTESRLVARSLPYADDGVANERIVASVESGTYFVVVRGPNESTGTRLELTSPTHDLQYVVPNGSVVAPASAPEVFTVGAYDERTGRAESFSSRGPTPDGRNGVDVVAPNRPAVAPDGFTGSSAAAAYAGGVAALVLDVQPGLSPEGVERRLERSARDLGEDGTDPVAGHGRIAPDRALGVARNATD
ncbi:S8 family serine peptidase [Halorussus amylolyticus]|uniref:S8 family serine peptidase n=1 Tax=Halorussus amylolyticus TaxID=1126242 RepID=UPI00104D9D78|nr:S8 family serine peptidase [Halorussus amylolyticus]